MRETVSTTSRETLANMFEGETPEIGIYAKLLLQTAVDQFGLTDLFRSTDGLANIPEEMVEFLKRIISGLSNEVIQAPDLVEERDASELLLNRFGLPQIPLAVPIFNSLTKNLVESHRLVIEKSLHSKNELLQMIKTIQALIGLYIDLEIERLTRERAEIKLAAADVVAQASDSIVNNRTIQARNSFNKTEQEKGKEIAMLSKTRNAWTKFVTGLNFSVSNLNFIRNRGISLAPDPSMAL